MADNGLVCASSVEVLSVLRDFRRTKKFCDITLTSGERNFYAHTCVLAAVSPFVLAAFRREMSEVNGNVRLINLSFLSVSAPAINLVLDYIYGESIEVHMENAFDVLVLADYMLLRNLKGLLSGYLTKNLSVEPHFCFTTWRFAERYGLKKLYKNSDNFLKKMFYQLSLSSAFSEITFDEVVQLLQSDDLSANENEVFESVVRWVHHSPEERKDYFPGLLKLVKPNTISRENFYKVLAEYDLAGALDHFDNDFLQNPDIPFTNCHRQGQEVALLFDKNNLQAYIPGSEPLCAYVSNLPENKHHFKVAVLDGMVYVLGGLNNGRLSLTVWRYDPSLDWWKKVAPLLKTAASFGLACLNGCLYASGGPNPKYNLQKYDPKLDVWCFGAPMQVVRQDHCLVAFQRRYLVAIGGYTPSTESLYSVEKCDIQSNIWSNLPPLNIGRIESGAVAHNDKIFVVGGYGGSNYCQLSSCEVYSSSTDQWELIESTTIPRRAAAVTIFHDKVFVVGGKREKQLTNTEYFCEKTQSWITGDTLLAQSPEQCCTVLLSGWRICDLFSMGRMGSTGHCVVHNH